MSQHTREMLYSAIKGFKLSKDQKFKRCLNLKSTSLEVPHFKKNIYDISTNVKYAFTTFLDLTTVTPYTE